MELGDILKKELEVGNLYESFLTLNLSQINKFLENSKTKKEKEFYEKLYTLILQTKQTELIEKGVF